MALLLPIWYMALTLGQDLTVQTHIVQVAPGIAASEHLTRSSCQTRAVVLIHGFHIRIPKISVPRGELHSYQQANSPLVKKLSHEADVFALTYDQTVPVDGLANLASFRNDIHALRNLGYTEIVLVGFSAGGLIARQFVEDMPNAGVTKVVQVDSPNLGTAWATGIHEPFRHSLTGKARRAFLQKRQGKMIPHEVEFVCVVGTGLGNGDGIVSVRSQWPEDLQAQGVPAYQLQTTHLQAARSQAGVQLITQLVQENQPRWDATKTSLMRKKLQEHVPRNMHPGAPD